MDKTLYITDLDGTLLRSDQSLSAFTAETLNALIDRGMLLSYATARSFKSASAVTRDIRFAVPVITRNGCVFADQREKKETRILRFSEDEVRALRQLLSGAIEGTGFVTAYFDGVMRKSYLDMPLGPGFQAYVDDYAGDPSMRPVHSADALYKGMATYVTLIAEKETLAPVYERVRGAGAWECVFQKDTYTDAFWLEICPPGATKEKAVLRLKQMLGCNKLIVFGDSPNDLSMFAAADVSCAVENAADEVKAAADVILPANDADGVAHFLMEEFSQKRERP